MKIVLSCCFSVSQILLDIGLTYLLVLPQGLLGLPGFDNEQFNTY